jgi:hypothetical protein
MKQEHRENLNWAVGLTMGITHAISGENGEEIKCALRAIARTIKEVLDETEEEGDE